MSRITNRAERLAEQSAQQFGSFATLAAIRRASSPQPPMTCGSFLRHYYLHTKGASKEESMAWTTPVLSEICIGLEINGYLPPEF
jgi:hypothetical protein